MEGFLYFSVICGFQEANAEALGYVIEILFDALATKSKDRHLLVHLVEVVRMIVILVVQQIEHSGKPFVTKRDPFGRGNIALVSGCQRLSLAAA